MAGTVLQARTLSCTAKQWSFELWHAEVSSSIHMLLPGALLVYPVHASSACPWCMAREHGTIYYICPVIELECFAMVLLYPSPLFSMHARLTRLMKPHNTLHTLHHGQTYTPSYFFEPIFYTH